MGLDVVELIMNIEAQYDIQISDSDARVMRSVGDLHEYILAHAHPAPDREKSWEWLCTMISEEFGVPRDRVTREAWVVRDLGIN